MNQETRYKKKEKWNEEKKGNKYSPYRCISVWCKFACFPKINVKLHTAHVKNLLWQLQQHEVFSCILLFVFISVRCVNFWKAWEEVYMRNTFNRNFFFLHSSSMPASFFVFVSIIPLYIEERKLFFHIRKLYSSFSHAALLFCARWIRWGEQRWTKEREKDSGWEKNKNFKFCSVWTDFQHLNYLFIKPNIWQVHCSVLNKQKKKTENMITNWTFQFIISFFFFSLLSLSRYTFCANHIF